MNETMRKAIVTAGVMLATVMQTLDSTIANVALPHMQGSVAATQDQIAWVLTSYIIAAAISTPLTAFLAIRYGRKRLLALSVVGFTVTSMLCGAAQTLDQIVFFRLAQGAFGRITQPGQQGGADLFQTSLVEVRAVFDLGMAQLQRSPCLARQRALELLGLGIQHLREGRFAPDIGRQ